MEEHPSREELLGFVRGELEGERAREVVRHLIQKCERCVVTIESLAGASGYDAALNGALRAARRAVKRVRRESEAAERVAKTLATQGLGAFDEVAATVNRLAVVEGLLRRSWELRHENPRAMVLLAQWAFGEANKLSEGKYGSRRVADVRCRAAAELGNALRVADRLDDAFFYFQRAEELLSQGNGDELLRVRILDLQASLAADLRNFALASNALTLVYQFHLRKGNRHLAGRALIKQGLYIGYAGQPERGIRLTREGLKLVDDDVESDLIVAAVHNILWLLVECGEFREARTEIFRRRPLESSCGRMNWLKFRWLEGRVEEGLQNIEQAETLFREVQAGLAEAGLEFQAALASLDLAAVLLKLREGTEAREVILKAVEVFQRLGIGREKLMAVLLLRRSIEQKIAADRLATALAEVIAFLRRAEHDPHARFDSEIP